MSAEDVPAAPVRSRPGTVFVEVVRLAVVVFALGVAFEVTQVDAAVEALGERQQVLILGLAVAIGYVAGGVAGRFAVGRIDDTERRLRSVSAGELLATVIGAVSGFVLGSALSWPVLLFGGKAFTLPLGALVVTLFTGAGLRIGAARGGDLLRFVGASGRLDVSSPSSGRGALLIDTSALIDGRLVDVCRSGFLGGTLVVPRFVLHELQGLADAAEPERRAKGRRGLDVLGALQRVSGVNVEVAERDLPDVATVDAKLVAMAAQRGSALVTVDANLTRVAEVQGVKVRNLHALADVLRPPVLPGDMLTLRVSKPGREPGQGVGYLDDGTMVVCEGGRSRQGADVTARVTSIMSNANGRMVFATLHPDGETAATPVRSVRAVADG